MSDRVNLVTIDRYRRGNTSSAAHLTNNSAPTDSESDDQPRTRESALTEAAVTSQSQIKLGPNSRSLHPQQQQQQQQKLRDRASTSAEPELDRHAIVMNGQLGGDEAEPRDSEVDDDDGRRRRHKLSTPNDDQSERDRPKSSARSRKARDAVSETAEKSSSAKHTRPRLKHRVLSRTMTEWKVVCNDQKLPDTQDKATDYVIVYRKPTADEDKPATGSEANHDVERSSGCCNCRSKTKQQRSEYERKVEIKRFRKSLQSEGIEIKEEHENEDSQLVFWLLHTPFWRLCVEAERVCMKMPLADGCVYDEDENCCVKAINTRLKTDNEDDYVSGPFLIERFNIYKDHDKPDIFFRPAFRSLLTHMILINLGNSKEKDDNSSNDNSSYLHLSSEGESTARKGLPHMLHRGFFQDAFTLHDEAAKDPGRRVLLDMLYARYGVKGNDEKFAVVVSSSTNEDTRDQLDRLWARSCRFQPLWRIRNYFGEKIALYFAWCGTLILSLWLPMLFGLGVFLYGIYKSARNHASTSASASWNNVSAIDKAKHYVEDSIGIIKQSFDNEVTPYYALVIAIWGTVFLELWKRTNNTLRYEWDVDSFEKTEPDRPEFKGDGDNTVTDPITGKEIPVRSAWRTFIRFSVSIGTLLFMVCLVFIIAAAIIVYRVVLTVDYCVSMSPIGCLIVTTVCSSLLNSVAIIILGKIYDFLAVKLTNWENHRTQTEYNDSLIIKTFAFQFANSYTSCFYIAFFRGTLSSMHYMSVSLPILSRMGTELPCEVFNCVQRAFQSGLFGLGDKYRDTCGDTDQTTCMSMLSFQILTLLIMKPIPKLLTDIVIPVAKWLWVTKMRKFFQRHCHCNKVSVDDEKMTAEDLKVPPHYEVEFHKNNPGDFTLAEYTEKVVIYGFVMLFAASLSIAPLLAMIIIAIDIRVDAKRLLWLYRRPVAFIVEDIGTWYTILEFLNILGVVTNACLVAFTSEWGTGYDITGQLLIVIGFEHIVFVVKFLLAALIPDVPAHVQLAQRREAYQNQLIRDQNKANRRSGLAAVSEEEELDQKTSNRRKTNGALRQ